MTIPEEASQLSEAAVLSEAPPDAPDTKQPPEASEDDEEAQDNPDDPRERKLNHWKRSPFAVGCVNVTWNDDNPLKEHPPGHIMNNQMAWSGFCCGSCLGAKRVGNMAVCRQRLEEYDEIQTNEAGEQTLVRRKRPKLLCMVGPYWPINLCLTWPLILGISGWTAWSQLPKQHIAIIITWSLCILLLSFSLFMVSCTNPGILYRHAEPPAGEEGDWRWNDQAKTYRPSHARFDNECQVVVEGFDHT
jgi:hypothetical protein